MTVRLRSTFWCPKAGSSHNCLCILDKKKLKSTFIGTCIYFYIHTNIVGKIFFFKKPYLSNLIHHTNRLKQIKDECSSFCRTQIHCHRITAYYVTEWKPRSPMGYMLYLLSWVLKGWGYQWKLATVVTEHNLSIAKQQQQKCNILITIIYVYWHCLQKIARWHFMIQCLRTWKCGKSNGYSLRSFYSATAMNLEVDCIGCPLFPQVCVTLPYPCMVLLRASPKNF
jgi:hypothetical protein